jgi:UDP-2,4-diacetamido-2,4,6-trideoxy-beta-L-altropyranose hydrolase
MALADQFAGRSRDVRFVCRAHRGNLVHLLRERGYRVDELPAPSDPPAGDGAESFENWLGVPQAEDAAQTIESLRDVPVDWLIADHYGLDANWEVALRRIAPNLLVIDDLANRRHACTLLLDQNYAVDGRSRYRDLIDDRCRLLSGPRYALIRPEYRARSRGPRGEAPPRRVFVFFGGTDPQDLTGRTLDALSAPEFSALAVDVVVGVNNAQRPELERRCADRGGWTIHGPRAHLADLMAAADIAIGAAGGTTWERLCVGLPSIVVTIADNQRPSAEAMASAGLIDYLGHYDHVSSRQIVAAVRSAIANPSELAQRALRGRRLVDGWGAPRLREIVTPSDTAALELRSAGPDDLLLYLDWVNDSDVRAQSIRTGSIAFGDHERWFHAKLDSPNSELFVMTAGSLPVGQVRFDREGRSLRIDYSIDRDFRGRGWAVPLLTLGLARARTRPGDCFVGEVKSGNSRSCAVFSSLGFEARDLRVADGLIEYRRGVAAVAPPERER